MFATTKGFIEQREFASEVIAQGLSWFGIKEVTPNAVNGAIEKAVNSMNLANQDVKPAEPEIAENVPEKDIVQPTEPTKNVTVNGN